MPRKRRVEYPGALDLVMSRRDRGHDIFLKRGQPITWFVLWLTRVAKKHNLELMPRQRRAEYPGAIYDGMSRGDRRQGIRRIGDQIYPEFRNANSGHLPGHHRAEGALT